MNVLWLLLFLPLFGVTVMSQSYKCLPADVKPDDIVTATSASLGSDRPTISKITVAQTLKKMRARCSRGKLVDSRGRQIRFYRLQGCWGNPPFNYLEILDQQRSELVELKKKYTVIEMTCNPGGIPIP